MTQLGGAANDNLFKFAFTVLVTYRLQSTWLTPDIAGLVIGALFILPYLLFSASAGQWADKWPKHQLMRGVKNLEILIMLLAAWGFVDHQVGTLLLCTFLMGLHSTVFGPAKYAYLPQVLQTHELTGGNGMVEMGTFVAILMGNLAGGLLIALPHHAEATVATVCVALAVLGRVAAHCVPATTASDPQLHIDWNPWRVTWQNLQWAHSDRAVWGALLGISWMWFFGAVFLSQFPAFAREVLHGDEQVASLLLVVFSVGIGLGSLMCESLSRKRPALVWSPLGAVAMGVFAIDLYGAIWHWTTQASYIAMAQSGSGTPWTVSEFLQMAGHQRLLFDLFGLSLGAGLYSVPMYALIQLRSKPSHRSRIIAANNIMNALFMIASAVIVGVLIKRGITIPEVFWCLGVANVGVAAMVWMWARQCLQVAAQTPNPHP